VKVWDLTTGKVVREFRGGHTSHVFDVKFDVRRVVSTSHDQKVVVMDFGTGLDTGLFL
jgi:F-box and WD-40 domain protein 1/11